MSRENSLLFEINSLFRILWNSEKSIDVCCDFGGSNIQSDPEIDELSRIFTVDQGIRLPRLGLEHSYPGLTRVPRSRSKLPSLCGKQNSGSANARESFSGRKPIERQHQILNRKVRNHNAEN